MVLEKFEHIAVLYQSRYMNPWWRENEGFDGSSWKSMRLFLGGYAYERQGRSPDYSFAAVDAIDRKCDSNLSSASAEEIWSLFKGILKTSRLNHVNNPLCPSGTTYQRKYKNQKRSLTIRNKSVAEIATALPKPLIPHLVEMVNQGQIVDAHRMLCKINGISNKIASFFLRDVAVYHSLKPQTDTQLFQPVDVWIRFVVWELSGDSKLDDEKCARWVVDNALKPELANQGIWYFCTAVAHSSQYVVNKALSSQTEFKRLMDTHLDSLNNTPLAVSTYQDRLSRLM